MRLMLFSRKDCRLGNAKQSSPLSAIETVIQTCKCRAVASYLPRIAFILTSYLCNFALPPARARRTARYLASGSHNRIVCERINASSRRRRVYPSRDKLARKRIKNTFYKAEEIKNIFHEVRDETTRRVRGRYTDIFGFTYLARSLKRAIRCVIYAV